ncbi:MAG: DoxX family protein [Gammaproteobacteria bacterium]|nr:DoxX family protein [Gammaproteobacteria bacterium]
MTKYSSLAARLLLAHIFVMAGFNKIIGYAGTQAYMESMGVTGMLLPLVILVELGAGLALVVGWQTRWAALGLAGFTVLAALIFHNNLSEQMQMIMFMKNMAITGGLLLIAEHGAGAFSLDNRK